MTFGNYRTYDEMIKLEDGGIGGIWSSFARGDVTIGDISGFLADSVQRQDHARAIFYAEKLAEYHEKNRMPGIAKSFRRTLDRQRRDYVQLLREALPGA